MYEVIIPKPVFKELSKLNRKIQELVFSKIKELEKENFVNDKALKGNHKGKFRKRAGDYRIIYVKEDNVLIITLLRIAHRKEVY